MTSEQILKEKSREVRESISSGSPIGSTVYSALLSVATPLLALLEKKDEALKIAATHPPHREGCPNECDCWKKVFIEALSLQPSAEQGVKLLAKIREEGVAEGFKQQSEMYEGMADKTWRGYVDTAVHRAEKAEDALAAYEKAGPEDEETKEALEGDCKYAASRAECQCAEKHREVLARALRAAWKQLADAEARAKISDEYRQFCTELQIESQKDKENLASVTKERDSSYQNVKRLMLEREQLARERDELRTRLEATP